MHQDLLYNKKLRRGFLYDKLRNNERNQKKGQETRNNNQIDFAGAANAEAVTNDTTELLLYLKTYVVRNGTTDLKRKLAKSVEIRRSLLQKDISEIKIMFPFYFVDPRLVGSHFNFNFKLDRFQF